MEAEQNSGQNVKENMEKNIESYQDFYSAQCDRYWEITEFPEGERYTDASNSKLKNDGDLMLFMMSKVHQGAKGLDAGCGPGARDVDIYQQRGFDLFGIDAVEANIELGRKLKPHIANKLECVDISQPLGYQDQDFDFVLCNCVIQHIQPETVIHTTLAEFARILRPGGILQLMFKTGEGETIVKDPEYNVDRHFHLYQPEFIVERLADLGLHVLPDDEEFGGVIHFVDPKPMPHCVLFAQKHAN